MAISKAYMSIVELQKLTVYIAYMKFTSLKIYMSKRRLKIYGRIAKEIARINA